MKKILLIGTGGTIASDVTGSGLVPGLTTERSEVERLFYTPIARNILWTVE